MPEPQTAKQMVHMRLEQALLKRLDDFRLKHRFDSRSAAARWLLEAALKAKLAPDPDEVK